MADSLERLVFSQLKATLEASSLLNWVKRVEYEEIKMATTEWGMGDLPVIQFWFEEELFEMQRNLASIDLRMTIEIIMKSTPADPVTQGVLLDRMRDVREAIGMDPRLSINKKGMLHMKLLRATRDFATQTPFFVGQLQMSVLGEVPYFGC